MINPGTEYWFKVEPIKWKVINDEKGLVTTEKALNGVHFYSDTDKRRTDDGSEVNPNNYKYSILRAFLNGYDGSSYDVSNYTNKGFYDVAFNDEEKAIIETTHVDNSLSSTGGSSTSYICEDTDDKVFALSYKEATNYFNGDSERETQISDYAAVLGVDVVGHSGEWWLRSPDDSDPDQCASVNYNGYCLYGLVNYPVSGVRPALSIKID